MADPIGANLSGSKTPMGGHRVTNTVTTQSTCSYPGTDHIIKEQLSHWTTGTIKTLPSCVVNYHYHYHYPVSAFSLGT